MSSKTSLGAVPSLDKTEFCTACARYATGIAIATVVDREGAPHGLTINSFTSVSLAPPLILFCVDRGSQVLAHFAACKYFGINILDEGQRDLSQHFARKGHDRFGGLKWQAGEWGAPFLPGVLATLECETQERFTAGDHDVILGRVLRTSWREGRPLIYFASKYRTLAE